MKTKIFIMTVCLFVSSLSIYSQDAKAFTRVYDRLDYLEEETNEWVIAGTDMNIVVEFNYMNYSDRIHIYFNNTMTIIYPDRAAIDENKFKVYSGIDNQEDHVYVMFSDNLGILILDSKDINLTMRFIESNKRTLAYPNELNNIKEE